MLAMVLYFNFARPLVKNILPGSNSEKFITRHSEHQFDFSLNGITADREEVASEA